MSRSSVEILRKRRATSKWSVDVLQHAYILHAEIIIDRVGRIVLMGSRASSEILGNCSACSTQKWVEAHREQVMQMMMRCLIVSALSYHDHQQPRALHLEACSRLTASCCEEPELNFERVRDVPYDTEYSREQTGCHPKRLWHDTKYRASQSFPFASFLEQWCSVKEEVNNDATGECLKRLLQESFLDR